jgi:endo-1,4-beta-xylanase
MVALPQRHRWLVEGSLSKPQVSAILKQHIQTVVGRYRGRVFAWDVVNEAVDDEGAGLRDTFWSKMLGSDYIARALTWAAGCRSSCETVLR